MISLQIILIAIGTLLADANDCDCNCDGNGVCVEQKALRTELTDFTKWNKYFDFVRRLEKDWQNQVAHVVTQQLDVRTSETMKELKREFSASQREGSTQKEDQTARIESVENSLKALHERTAELDLTMEMISSQISGLKTELLRMQRVPKCGIDFDNGGNNGEVDSSKNLVWPWMAALYRNKSEYYCDGSVIHRYFILTGAECAIHARNMIVTVKLGLSDLKNGAHLQEYTVRTAHIHPEYKRGPGEYDNLDYDIGLLEVDAITFGPFVRPICLPPREMPQDQPFLQPQSTSKVVHLQSYIRSPTTASPTVLNLPVLSREECRKEIKDRRWNVYFPSRYFTFCGEGAIKCPLRGSPVIQSRLEGDGTRTWTQVSIQCLCLDSIVFGPRLDHLRAWMDTIIEPNFKQ